MEKKDLTITVSGQFASGKSCLVYLLKKFLKEQGFDLNFEGSFDHSTEDHFDYHISKNFDKAVETLKQTCKLRLKEVQLAKETKETIICPVCNCNRAYWNPAEEHNECSCGHIWEED